MNSVQKPKRTIINATILTLLATGVAQAGSFSLYTESSGAATGNYAAGIAAEAADASTAWYNPAGLVLLHTRQLVLSGVGVSPNSELTGTSTYHTPGFPSYVQSYKGINGGKDAIVPALHYAHPLGQNVTAGISLVAPFGLSTDWGASGPVRYSATLSKLMTTNISPAMGVRLSEHVPVGAGLDFQYSNVTFNRVIGSPALGQVIGQPLFFDSTSENKGNSFGMGFHAGTMVMFNDNHSRVGLNYQSTTNHKFHGTSHLTGILASPTLSDPTAVFSTDILSSNNIEFPEIVTLSGYHDVNEKVALLGSVVYTGWHTLRMIQLNNVAANVPPLGPTLVNSTSTQYYRDAWRVALGANYKVNQQWMLRVGGGYDETPTRDAFRDVRIADANRWALSVGTHYQPRPAIGLDLGYTHLFTVSNTSVNKTEEIGTSSYNVNASASGAANLIGAQLTWTLDNVSPVSTK